MCILVDFHYGKLNRGNEIFEEKLKCAEILLPSVVITEYLSNLRLDHKYYKFFQDMPTLEIHDGY